MTWVESIFIERYLQKLWCLVLILLQSRMYFKLHNRHSLTLFHSCWRHGSGKRQIVPSDKSKKLVSSSISLNQNLISLLNHKDTNFAILYCHFYPFKFGKPFHRAKWRWFDFCTVKDLTCSLIDNRILEIINCVCWDIEIIFTFLVKW